MSKIYVRIQPKQKNTSRFRAGRKFGKAWTELDGIDAATLASLKADQMLQVSDILQRERCLVAMIIRLIKLFRPIQLYVLMQSKMRSKQWTRLNQVCLQQTVNPKRLKSRS